MYEYFTKALKLLRSLQADASSNGDAELMIEISVAISKVELARQVFH